MHNHPPEGNVIAELCSTGNFDILVSGIGLLFLVIQDTNGLNIYKHPNQMCQYVTPTKQQSKEMRYQQGLVAATRSHFIWMTSYNLSSSWLELMINRIISKRQHNTLHALDNGRHGWNWLDLGKHQN